MKGKIGLQLYSIRNVIDKENLEEVLEEVKAIGYEGVEFFDFYGKSAHEIARIMEKVNLEPISSHVDYEKILKNTEETIGFHKEIGCKNIIVPWLSEKRFKDKDAVKETAKDLSELAERVEERGLKLGYHNHDQEIVKVNDITAFELFDKLISDKLMIQPDVGNAEKAGIDAAEYFFGFKSEFISLHVKDAKRKGGAEAPLGEGDVNLKKYIQMGERRNISWYIIENEGSTAPMNAVRNDFNFLNSLKIQS
ncbi:MAG: sugar phosphate isomerase/epimerase family protein [Candidatus Hadarchaeia archaeon]